MQLYKMTWRICLCAIVKWEKKDKQKRVHHDAIFIKKNDKNLMCDIYEYIGI